MLKVFMSMNNFTMKQTKFSTSHTIDFYRRRRKTSSVEIDKSFFEYKIISVCLVLLFFNEHNRIVKSHPNATEVKWLFFVFPPCYSISS